MKLSDEMEYGVPISVRHIRDVRGLEDIITELREKVGIACGELLSLQHNICEGHNMDSDTTMMIDAILKGLHSDIPEEE